MKSLAGKVVVITGAGSGIGREVALRAASEGARLALSDVSREGLNETERLVRARSQTQIRTDVVDVRDREAIATYANAVASAFGVVNVLINNAGIGYFGYFEEMSYEDFEWVMDINFWGVVRGTKEFLPHLIASGDGHIVNLSSMDGLIGVAGQSQYCASKFAVRGFTEALRQELILSGHPVGVTAVHPGSINTPIARNAGMAGGRDRGAYADFFEKRMAVTSPEKAADAIVRGVLKGRPRVLVGPDAYAADLASRIAGPHYQGLTARIAGRVERLVQDGSRV